MKGIKFGEEPERLSGGQASRGYEIIKGIYDAFWDNEFGPVVGRLEAALGEMEKELDLEYVRRYNELLSIRRDITELFCELDDERLPTRS